MTSIGYIKQIKRIDERQQHYNQALDQEIKKIRLQLTGVHQDLTLKTIGLMASQHSLSRKKYLAVSNPKKHLRKKLGELQCARKVYRLSIVNGVETTNQYS